MGKNSKSIMVIITVVLALSSLTAVEIANATTYSKPPVPQFSIDVTEYSYVVPEKISIDQFTGSTSTAPAYNLTKVNVTVTITNSPLATAYILEVKGHYGSSWSIPTMNDPMSNGIINVTAFASSGAQTIITLSGSGSGGLAFSDHWSIDVPPGGQLDFRLQAINGEAGLRVFGGTAYEGAASDWSPTKTITFAVNSTANTPYPTSASSYPNPTVPEFPVTIAVTLLLVTTLSAAAVLRGKFQVFS